MDVWEWGRLVGFFIEVWLEVGEISEDFRGLVNMFARQQLGCQYPRCARCASEYNVLRAIKRFLYGKCISFKSAFGLD